MMGGRAIRCPAGPAAVDDRSATLPSMSDHLEREDGVVRVGRVRFGIYFKSIPVLLSNTATSRVGEEQRGERGRGRRAMSVKRIHLSECCCSYTPGALFTPYPTHHDCMETEGRTGRLECGLDWDAHLHERVSSGCRGHSNDDGRTKYKSPVMLPSLREMCLKGGHDMNEAPPSRPPSLLLSPGHPLKPHVRFHLSRTATKQTLVMAGPRPGTVL